MVQIFYPSSSLGSQLMFARDAAGRTLGSKLVPSPKAPKIKYDSVASQEAFAEILLEEIVVNM